MYVSNSYTVVLCAYVYIITIRNRFQSCVICESILNVTFRIVKKRPLFFDTSSLDRATPNPHPTSSAHPLYLTSFMPT